jgi:Carboxypeptidase regulatory-like domain
VIAILWCGFGGNLLTVAAEAAPAPTTDPQNIQIDRVQAIVNTLPAQQLQVQGEFAATQQQPANVDRWLLPFDTTLKLLDIQQRQLPTGEIELTSPYLLVRLQPQQIFTDPRLGRAISLGDLRKLPGLKIEFADRSIGNREIVLKFSYTLPKTQPKIATEAAPVSLAGLTTIEPPTTSLSAVQERINLSGSTSDRLNTQGEFKAVGTVLGSSWYLRVEQPKLSNLLTWGVTDAVVINQSTNSDWIAGSQSPFWRRQGNPTGAYWGVTTIQRQDFTPPTSLTGGDFLPNERLQSSRLGRTVSGQAQPGTVVRLVRGFSTDVVGQVLVDSSGVFRFENVVVSKDGELGNGYRLLLYPNGQLTADPQVREVTFTTVPGQLPAGSGALIASAGVNYNRGSNQFIGQFDGLQGGVAYRRGISESLTLGGGIIADPLALRGSGELFWQPTGVPLQASVSALTGDRWDVVSSVNYQPGTNFSANFSSDKLSSRTDLNWLLTPTLTASAKYDSLSGVAIGGNYNFSLAPNSYSNIQGTFDSNSFLRWSASHQQNSWQLGLQGNEISFNSEVSYQLPSGGGSTQNLIANYQSTYVGTPTTLSQFSWRYHSNTFQSELGYGWSGFGRGANAGIGVTLSPGLQLMGKYQGISAFTSRESFSLELQSTLDLQGGSATSTRVEELRTRGGIAIQPFFDRNGNGKQDPGEESYWHPQLISLDQKALSASQTNQLANRVEVRAAPGSYRIDLNAAHLPAYWRSTLVDPAGKPLDSLRVNVALGSYTTIAIPLTPIYTIKGIAIDPTGKPLPNTTVTAIQIGGKTDRRETVTKADGSYEFGDLALGAYEISIPGQSPPAAIAIASTSPVLQQLNLKQTAPSHPTPRDRFVISNCEMIFTHCWQGF